MQQNFFQLMECRFPTAQKIHEKESLSSHLDVYEVKNFGMLFVVDQERFCWQQDMVAQDEMVSSVAYFTHAQPKSALVLDGVSFGVAHYLSQYAGLHVDFVSQDVTLIKEISSFFPAHTHVMERENLSFVPSSWLDWLEKIEDVQYDLIVVDHVLQNDELSVVKEIENLLSDEGIAIFKVPHFRFSSQQVREVLGALQNFSVLMPFGVPQRINEEYAYLFASKKPHPLANIKLQRIDMAGPFEYYSEAMHKAVFALPEYIRQAYADLVIN